MAFNLELPVLTSVRSENSIGKLIEMAPMRIWPAWFNRTAVLFLILGAATAVYFVIRAIQLLAASGVAAPPAEASGASGHGSLRSKGGQSL